MTQPRSHAHEVSDHENIRAHAEMHDELEAIRAAFMAVDGSDSNSIGEGLVAIGELLVAQPAWKAVATKDGSAADLVCRLSDFATAYGAEAAREVLARGAEAVEREALYEARTGEGR